MLVVHALGCSPLSRLRQMAVPTPTKAILRQTATVLLAVAAVALGVSRVVRSAQTGEAAAQVWFYDASEQKLYAVPNETIPPHQGVGGQRGDGFKAAVFCPRGQQRDPSQRRIAYLETYGPALKKVMEDIHAARSAHRHYEGQLPERESAFVETNTLVRSLEDPRWYPSASPEGRDIIQRWRHWRGADGHPGVISVP